jgi:riboflavin kinase/FMN adenylyltransferase
MQLIRRLSDFPSSLGGGALTIGNFDGVHRGHERLIGSLNQFADQLNGAAIVFTFDPHPVRILRPDQCPPPLTWTDRKADLLAELGVDVVIAFPTNAQLLELSYQDFFQRIVVEQIGAKAMVEGPNFFFGHRREGDTAKLAELCRENQIQLSIVEPLVSDSQFISSSRIRQLIQQGQVEQAASMLTHPYRIRGMVTHGAGRGATIGFPTANLDAIDTLVPAMGVYAGRTYVDGRPHWSAIHIGPNPTFREQVPKVESHILDFESSLYGMPIEVDFVARLRDIEKFAGVSELIRQLQNDIAQTRTLARSQVVAGNSGTINVE